MPEKKATRIDPVQVRLDVIREAVAKGFPIDKDTPDWLSNGVRLLENGGVISPEWLEKQDKENSVI